MVLFCLIVVNLYCVCVKNRECVTVVYHMKFLTQEKK